MKNSRWPKSQNLVLISQTTSKVPVRINCEVVTDTIQMHSKHRILDLYLYVYGNVFFGMIDTLSLNKELTWNQKFFETLKNCLNNKNKNVSVEFSSETFILKIFCDFEGSNIRILFFQTEMTEIHEPPMKHAQMILHGIEKKNQEKLLDLKNKRREIEGQIEKIYQLTREVKDTHEFQMQYMKNKFIPIINEAKTKLRPHFNPDLPRQNPPASEDSEESSTRKIYKIKKSSSSNMKSLDFDKLFD